MSGLADRGSSTPLLIPKFLSEHTCLQKETGEFHVLSLRTMAACSRYWARELPMAATRSRLYSAHAWHSASVWSAVSTYRSSRWLHLRWLLSDQIQVITEQSFPSDHLRQPVWEGGPMIPLEPMLHNGIYHRNNVLPKYLNPLKYYWGLWNNRVKTFTIRNKKCLMKAPE